MTAPDATRDPDMTGVADELDQAERAVMVALASGQPAAEIAAALRVSEEMLGITMANVLAKLHRQHAAVHDDDAGTTRVNVGAFAVRPATSGLDRAASGPASAERARSGRGDRPGRGARRP